jgi:hypothetical protein
VADHQLPKLIWSRDGSPSGTLALEVVPYELVGIQIRRIAWQKKQLQPPLHRCHEFLSLYSLVRGMPVNHQVDRMPRAFHQVPQELNEHIELWLAATAQMNRPLPCLSATHPSRQ